MNEQTLTVVPSSSSSSKVLPSGTVKDSMLTCAARSAKAAWGQEKFTVVHLIAAATSSSDEIVPVHRLARSKWARRSGVECEAPARTARVPRPKKEEGKGMRVDLIVVATGAGEPVGNGWDG